MKTVFEQFNLVSIQNIIIIIVSLAVVVLLQEKSLNLKQRGVELIIEYQSKEVQRQVKEVIGKSKEGYVMIGLIVLMSVVVLNLIGLISYSYAITASLVVAGFLGISIWLGKVKVGLKKGIKKFGDLLPSGVPFGLIPFFVIIESISYIIPAVQLQIRLFANVLSGHVLIHVLLEFVDKGFVYIEGFGVLVGFLTSILSILFILETGVSIVQGYVLMVLFNIYIGDEIKGH